MKDEEMETIIPREVLVKEGTSAAVYLLGGVFLFVMTIGGRLPVLGIVLSAAAVIVGAAALFSKSRDDRKPGIVIGASGVLGIFLRFGPRLFRPFAAFALILGALGLFAAGIWKGVQFLSGLKSRR